MDLTEDLALAIDAAKAAGALAMEYFGKDVEIWHKDNHTPVSEADIKVDMLLTGILRGARPDYGWLSEESEDDGSKLRAKKSWIIDPIDGTRAFIKGVPHFSVSIGLIENGKAVLGVIFNPATNEMFYASLGQGAYKNGKKITASHQNEIKGARMLGDFNMFVSKKWPSAWPYMRIEKRNSIAYRMALVACGEFDAAIATTPKNDWDVCAGTIIIEEAQGKISDHIGRDFDFSRPDCRQRSVIASGPSLYPQLLQRLSHIKD